MECEGLVLVALVGIVKWPSWLRELARVATYQQKGLTKWIKKKLYKKNETLHTYEYMNLQ